MIPYRVPQADGTWTHKSERLHGLDGKKAARAALEEKTPGNIKPDRRSKRPDGAGVR